jgi:hypothetical protein
MAILITKKISEIEVKGLCCGQEGQYQTNYPMSHSDACQDFVNVVTLTGF